MTLIDADKLHFRHMITRDGHQYTITTLREIRTAEEFDLEAFEKQVREDERQKSGPVEWNSVWYSKKFEEMVKKFNETMADFDGKEQRIKLTKHPSPDKNFHGECTITADSMEDMLLLMDELISHVLDESGEDYSFK